MATATREDLGKALGKIVSGLYIVTSGKGDTKRGMLASWVMQAGFEPPLLTVAVKQDREILQQFEANQHFVVNVLGQDSNGLMKPFTKYTPNAFEGLNYEESPSGVVLKDAVSALHCTVKQQFDAGEHILILAEITDGQLLNESDSPATHTRKNGFSY